MKAKVFLLVIIIFLSIQDAICGCLACWKLHRADIELKSGEKYDVYLLWNDEWLENEFRPYTSIQSFPEILTAGIRDWKLTAYFYYDLKELKYPEEKLLVSINSPLEIFYDTIKDVILKDGRFNEYGGAGSLPVVNYTVIELLKTKPCAQYKYHNEGGLSDVYWLSYNEEITEDDLSVISKRPFRYLIKYNEAFIQEKIIRLEFFYD